MRRESLLVAGAVVVVVSTLLATALVPGLLAQPTDDFRPDKLYIEETSLTAADVGGEQATLRVTTSLAHAGGPTENVTVRYRAIDLDTGLLVAETTTEVGTFSKEAERTVSGDLTVDREGGYRLETVVFADERRRIETSTDVDGVGTLKPAYAESSVQFKRFDDGIPTVQYAIDDVENNRTTLAVSTYLENQGDEPAGDLRLVVQARQAESNIVAARAETVVGTADPGNTVAPETTLTVPTGYNYYLDAVLWKDGVVVGTARSAANLDPTETISVNETRRSTGLKVGDFDQSDDSGSGGPEETGAPTTASAGPGFGVVVALLALLGSALLARRWSA
jgi:PGF-CTERM protein